jgi:hypothetical protein
MICIAVAIYTHIYICIYVFVCVCGRAGCYWLLICIDMFIILSTTSGHFLTSYYIYIHISVCICIYMHTHAVFYHFFIYANYIRIPRVINTFICTIPCSHYSTEAQDMHTFINACTMQACTHAHLHNILIYIIFSI